MMRVCVYTIVAPLWRAQGRPKPTLNRRRWLRWDLVRETRQPTPDGPMAWGYEHLGYFWTWRAADRVRWNLETQR